MKQQIVVSLQQAIDSLPHPSVEELASIPVTKMTEHDFITRQELTTQKSIFHIKRIAIALCCLCLFVIIARNYLRTGSQTPYSFLTLDVNPGFEILLDKKNAIIAIQGVNEEAKALLEDSSYQGSDVMDTVSDLMLRLVNANYLTVNHNTILLTVQCSDEAFLQELESNLSTTIQSTLQKENISPNLVIQKKNEKSPTALPKDNITKGKQYFIDSILSKYPNLSGEKLGSLSLDELLTLLASGSLPAISDKVISPTSPEDGDEDSDDTDDIFDDKDDKENDKEFENKEKNDDLEDSKNEENLDTDSKEDEDEDDVNSSNDEDSIEEREDEDLEDLEEVEDSEDNPEEKDSLDDTEDSESETMEDTDLEDSDTNEDTSIETNTGIQDVSDPDEDDDNDTDSSEDSLDDSSSDSTDNTGSSDDTDSSDDSDT